MFPKLRFKEFDGNWNLLTFSDVFKFYNTNSYSRALLEENGEIMNIHYGDIHTKFSMLFDVEKEKAPYLSKEIESHKINEDNFLKVGDLVIADASEDYKDIGKTIEIINLNNKKVVAGLHTYIARPLKPFALGFNGYLMQTHTIRTQIQKLATGISVLGISKTNISKVELYLPSPEEQTKIASFLSAVDEKISQLSQKHQLLSQYKQGMMQKLFSQQVRFKADDKSEFGEWEEKPLIEITSKASGKNKDGSVTEVLTNSATKGIIKQSDYFDREIVTESNLNGYYIVNIDDFVYNPRISVHAPVGPIKRNKQCLGVMSPLYTVFKITQGNLTYLEYFFDSNFWHDYVKSVANSGARHDRMNITNKDFFDMPVLYPSLEEQTKIANFLSSIDQKIEVVAQQIEQAKQWKKGLLQNMFI
ncbi:restriction endonuclease subunit S [Acinetobacter indicus]|uniref:restriction endonuclease subunit S n=1 Tax=Acinetobacter indicus TaxID=756892 RepID=UPI000FDB2913|nr:restriction endonuclease subunit S [Acinetobacter indicus]RVT52910.1 restriction endonuclease subunit S [Acinetobacter indicus]